MIRKKENIVAGPGSNFADFVRFHPHTYACSQQSLSSLMGGNKAAAPTERYILTDFPLIPCFYEVCKVLTSSEHINGGNIGGFKFFKAIVFEIN